MEQRKFFILILIVCILIIQVSANDQYLQEDDDEYRQLKQLFLNQKTASKYPSIIGNLIHSSSISSPVIWNQESTYSSSGSCTSNPCEHGGICIPKGQMAYSCKCPDDRYGEHCEKRFYKRKVSNQLLYSQLLNKMKRNINRKNVNDIMKHDNKEERVYYDYRNGLYF